jgi:hypothetical protein
MSDPTVEQLGAAMERAFKSGDMESAKQMAAAIASVSAQTAPKQSIGGGMMDSVTQGMAFNLGDELTAAEAALLGKTPDGAWFDYSQSMGDRYDAALAAERGQQKQFAKDHKYLDAIGEVGGALATGVGAGRAGLTMMGGATTTAGNIGRGAAEGLAYGAAYGAGGGEGARDRGLGALEGGALGAVAGGALTGAAQGIGKAFANRAASRRAAAAGVSPRATRLIGRDIDADGLDEIVSNVRRGGDDAMLADGGMAVSNRLDSAVNNSVAGAGKAWRAVSGRVAKAGETLKQTFDDTLGKVGESSSREMIVYGDKTNPLSLLYRRAYSTPIDYASRPGRRVEALMKRVPKSEIDAANRLILMDPDAVDVKQMIAKIADDGTVVFDELPTVQQIDYVTRALNGVADQNAGKGALGGNTTTGRAYRTLSKHIRSALKEAVPEYKQVLETAGTEIGKRQARDTGLNMLRSRVSVDEVREALDDMPAAEVAKVKEGVRAYLDEVASTAKRNATNPDIDAKEFAKGLSELSNRMNRTKLRLLLGDKEGTRVARKVDELWRALELQARIARGSATAVRKATDREAEAMTAPGFIRQTLSGHPVKAAQDLAADLTGQTREAQLLRKDALYKELVGVLTDRRGNAAVKQAEELVAALKQRGATPREIQMMIERIGGAPAAVGGEIGGARPISGMLTAPGR